MSAPDPTPTNTAGIAARLGEISEQMESIRTELKEESRQARRRSRIHMALIVVALTVACVGIIVGVGGWQAQHERDRDREEAARASCLQYNEQQRQGIASDIAQSHDFINALIAGRDDLADEARQYNERHDQLIRDGHPLRDCSSEGIEEYFDGQGP